MRPLPTQPVGGTPGFVRGLAIIRGELVPVLDLAQFFGEPTASYGSVDEVELDAVTAAARRFVLMRAGERRLAIAVGAVLRVVTALPPGTEVAPLVGQALPHKVRALAALDDTALAILESAQLLPEAMWQTLAESLDQ
jgi:purine-binding chemotaxis protein CheW